MSRPFLFRLGVLSAAAFLAAGGSASADQWNDRTIMKFSEPVMVPGATLQPGTYVFELMDTSANRNVVQITTEDQSKVLAIAQAVPMKRAEAKGDVVVKLKPTEAGSPPAVSGWFFPGSLYGHQFIYPEEQARQIAERTKTLVLSVDVPGSDMEKGTLHTYDGSGKRAEWKGDAATLKEWDEWQTTRRATAKVAAPQPPAGRPEAGAPMIEADQQGTAVRVDQLEDNARQYIGKTVSVDAEIEDVLGPRMFTIDEPRWGDLEGEILVYVPTSLAALVREDDRVTVTGTVKSFVRSDVEREWGWIGLDPEIELEFAKRPVIVASRVVGGTNNTAMLIEIDSAPDKPVGTTGGSAAPLTDLNAIAQGRDEFVGRRVSLTGLKVDEVAKGGGFFTRAPNGMIFVLPAHPDKTSVQAGDSISVDGVILQLPREMKKRLRGAAGDSKGPGEVYVYATDVRK
ncbi:MAG TPA: hypothetical protein VD833_19785 [Vicinamibacterales bacterium]|nr:hypothetical protein [Vicinamibacterales bacterium]